MQASRSFKSLFSLPDDLHYLNCAYMAPLSRRVAAAGHAALERLGAPSRVRTSDFFEPCDRVRNRFARLVNVTDPQRIALIPSVSYAMATVARNVDVAPGRNLVFVEGQFPSNVHIWRRLAAARGAELRPVAAPRAAGARGRGWNEALLAAIDERTALATVPPFHWTDGSRFDLEAVGGRARAAGAAFIVDGTQAVGAVPFDCARIAPDALVCAGYKWLTGPYSVGVAYFGPAFDGGVPLEENWITRRGSDDFANLANGRDEYRPGAIRYDVGERSNFVLMPMLDEALAQVSEWGPAAVEAHTRALTDAAAAALRDLGCGIEEDAWRAPHLLGVRLPPGLEPAALAGELRRRQVSVSVRGRALRVAPHLYNDADDLAALVEVVRDSLA
ncbi:MAG: aminotransferase class V-fold PLP-dependent enzyme [Acidobacteria bacterium]|nr:aminotransferase class V-fold PLP-dependent enzyme [Acidobacteriota bacterium]